MKPFEDIRVESSKGLGCRGLGFRALGFRAVGLGA